MKSTVAAELNLGDIVVVLLTSSLAGLHERLRADGYSDAASLVADLLEIADDYLIAASGAPSRSAKSGGPARQRGRGGGP